MSSRSNHNGRQGRPDGSSGGGHHFHPLFTRALNGAQGINRSPLSPVTAPSSRVTPPIVSQPTPSVHKIASNPNSSTTVSSSTTTSNNSVSRRNIQIKGTSAVQQILESASRSMNPQPKSTSSNNSNNNIISIKGLANREPEIASDDDNYDTTRRRSSTQDIPEEGISLKRLRAERTERFESNSKYGQIQQHLSKHSRRGSQDYTRNSNNIDSRKRPNPISSNFNSTNANDNSKLAAQNVSQRTLDSPKYGKQSSPYPPALNRSSNNTHSSSQNNELTATPNDIPATNNELDSPNANAYSEQYYQQQYDAYYIRCRYFPGCNLGNSCKFYHPTEICPLYPNCPAPSNQCMYIHPTTEKPRFNAELSAKIPCRYGKYCRTVGCGFLHTPDMEATKCKYGKLCANAECKYPHDMNYIPPFVVKRVLPIDPVTRLPLSIKDSLTKRSNEILKTWKQNVEANTRRLKDSNDANNQDHIKFEIHFAQESPAKGTKASVISQIISSFPIVTE